MGLSARARIRFRPTRVAARATLQRELDRIALSRSQPLELNSALRDEFACEEFWPDRTRVPNPPDIVADCKLVLLGLPGGPALPCPVSRDPEAVLGLILNVKSNGYL